MPVQAGLSATVPHGGTSEERSFHHVSALESLAFTAITLQSAVRYQRIRYGDPSRMSTALKCKSQQFRHYLVTGDARQNRMFVTWVSEH